MRKRRYLRGNTELLGHRFDYTADPRRILVGNAIVVPSAPLPDQPIPATAAVADPASPALLPEAASPSPPADEKAAAS